MSGVGAANGKVWPEKTNNEKFTKFSVGKVCFCVSIGYYSTFSVEAFIKAHFAVKVVRLDLLVDCKSHFCVFSSNSIGSSTKILVNKESPGISCLCLFSKLCTSSTISKNLH